MTDRFNSFIVVLEQNIRDDDAEPIINAIKQIRGVLQVTGNISDVDSIVAYERARNELGRKLWAVIYPTKEA